MSTRINITIDSGGLLDRNAQQTAANRQAKVLADQRAAAETLGVERRAADRIAAGLDPLTGLPASTPSSASTINRLDQEPAANRRLKDVPLHIAWIGQSFRFDDEGEASGKYYVGSGNASAWKEVNVTQSKNTGKPDVGPIEVNEWAVANTRQSWVDADGIHTFKSYGPGTYRGLVAAVYSPNFIGSPVSSVLDPFWIAIPTDLDNTRTGIAERAILLPAGGDTAVVIVKRDIKFSWVLNQLVWTAWGGGNFRDKTFLVPSPWFDRNNPYYIGRAYGGLTIAGITASLNPNPRTDENQEVSFQIYASPTYEEDHYAFLFFGKPKEEITGKAITDIVTVNKSGIKSGGAILEQPESGDYLWFEVKSFTGGDIAITAPYSRDSRQEVLITLVTGAGSVGPQDTTNLSWEDAAFTFKTAGGATTLVNVTDTFLVNSTQVKEITTPAYVNDKIIPRITGAPQLVPAVAGTVTQSAGNDGAGNFYWHGADSREFAFSKLTQGNFRTFNRKPGLAPAETNATFLENTPSVIFDTGNTPYNNFPLRLGYQPNKFGVPSIDDYAGEVTTPVIFYAIKDNYRGSTEDTLEQQRENFGVPKYDVRVDLGNVGEPEFFTDSSTLFERAHISVSKVEYKQNPDNPDEPEENVAATAKRRLSPTIPEPFLDESNGYTYYYLQAFTDWGNPQFCRQELLSMGFSPEDLTFAETAP
jgi:hypothetical protein